MLTAEVGYADGAYFACALDGLEEGPGAGDEGFVVLVVFKVG